MSRLLPTVCALGAAALGSLNLDVALDLGVHVALQSPDAWLPLTASLAGWLVLRLSPRNVVGWLLLVIALSSAVFGAAALVVLGPVDVPWILGDLAAWLSTWAFLPSYLFAFLLVPLLFPDGRLPSRHWRPVLAASLALVAVESLLLAFGSAETVDVTVPNPWQVELVGDLLGLVEPVIWVSMPVLVLLGIASLAQRIVRGTGEERRAAIAFAAAAGVGAAFWLVTGQGLVLGLLLPLVVVAAVAEKLHLDLGSQLARAERQAAELRASRARITRAHDNARRSIERDLHDGAQQGLLALAVDLGRLGTRTEGATRAEAERLHGVAQRTLVELRRLAAGTYPSALRELGVGAALREAIGHDADVDVVIRDGLDARPREETEAAIYFACLEAVTNARKHAQASTIHVLLDRTDDDGYRFTVRDDGVGMTLPSYRSACAGTGLEGRGLEGTGLEGTGLEGTGLEGTGMAGMADRVGARGGHLTLETAPGSGTTVTGVVYDSPR